MIVMIDDSFELSFRIIYDKTTREYIYVGGDKGLFVRWNLVRDKVIYHKEFLQFFFSLIRMAMIYDWVID